MSKLIVPASPWRRLIASIYDGLVLLAIWLAVTAIEFLIRDTLLGLPLLPALLQAALLGGGLAFFGWFWIHGGQTLGMRAWRLQVRRLDGAGLRWPIAALRYGVMLLTWAAALAPIILLVPAYASSPRAQAVAMVCVLLSITSLVLMSFESRRRAWCDWAAGTEVVALPKEAPRGSN